MLDLLLASWPILLLLYLPRLARMIAATVFARTKGTLDHRIPDDLPLTAGAWLSGRLESLGYPIEAVVSDRQVSAYWPSDKVIQLDAETAFKADPVYWAIAAHEIGHARIRFERPVIGHLRTWSTRLGRWLRAAGIGLAFGRVLYAMPVAGDLAFGCFAVAVALAVFALLDEAVASVLAYRELRATEALDVTHLRAIRRVLIAAFSTYLVTYLGYALLLLQWPLLDELAAPVSPTLLTTLGLVVVATASILCLVYMVVCLAAMFAPAEMGQLLEVSPWLRLLASVARLAPVPLVWVAWDHRLDAVYAWCAILMFAASSNAWLQLVHWPHLIPHGIAKLWLAPRLAGPGLEVTPRYASEREQGTRLIERGNRLLDTFARARARRPARFSRLQALAALGRLPLLVAFWLG